MCGSEISPRARVLSDSQVLLLEKAEHVARGDAEVPSPCIGVCKMDDANGLCSGCWRSLDELAGWGQASDAFKREVWAKIATRIQSS